MNRLLGAAFLLCFAGVAWAQDGNEEDDGVITMQPDEGLAPEAGDSEQPGDPKGAAPPAPDQPAAGPEAPPKDPDDDAKYPTAFARRPVVLPAGILEVAMEFPVNVKPFAVVGLLRGRFGLRGGLELGATYGLGTFFRDGGTTEYTGGDALGIEAVYDLLSLGDGKPFGLWLGIQAGLPLLFDPFSAGLVIGAPFKLTILGKLSVTVGRDLVAISLYRFAPNLSNPQFNQAQADADAANTILPDGEFRFIPEFAYQIDREWAVSTRFGLTAPDFDTGDPPVLLDVGLAYSQGAFDIGVRTGFSALDDAKNSFFASLQAALRL